MDLNDYLKLNSNVIIDLARKYVPAEMTKEPTFEELAAQLMGIAIVRDGKKLEKEIKFTMLLQWQWFIQCGMDGFPKKKQIVVLIRRSWSTGLGG